MRQKDDLISRQAVLSYIDRIMHQGTGKQKSFEFIRKHVEKMPSAEMPKRTEKFIQNVPNVDLISRKTAIEALTEYERDSTAPIDYRGILMALPFAQPDLSEYSEKLRRAAYERGKKDAQLEIVYCRECIHWRYDTDHTCRYYGGASPRLAIDFCSKGERRTDE